jgi:hypothetical protein
VNCLKPAGRGPFVLYDEIVFIKDNLILEKGVDIMAQPGLQKKAKIKVEDSSSLKGTLASVFLLGFFLIITWFGVFYLFVERF